MRYMFRLCVVQMVMILSAEGSGVLEAELMGMWRTYGNMSPGECMREGKESKIITKDACMMRLDMVRHQRASSEDSLLLSALGV